uniref:AB hydrolase-1 domain-containing protein n=1 Tax=Bionectria ochroleuca TaxID=29856 RepID=A0A8H7K317_BIOOC
MGTNRYEQTQVLGPNDRSNICTSPLIICFHGSGDSCASWSELAQLLATSYRVLLYNRGPSNPDSKASTKSLVQYLAEMQLGPPYVLIGHSYGGNFAREFLQQRISDVIGMVLAETGQETALDPVMEAHQYKRTILGTKPLSVIRANSMIGKMKQLEEKIQHAQGDEKLKSEIRNGTEFVMVEAWDKEDERLKKRQLDLSKNSRYLHIPDCGHHVIRDRPDAVAGEVRWVMENCNNVPDKQSHGVMKKLWGKLLR